MRRLFRNTTLIDGTGAAARPADVLVEDQHVAEVAPVGGTSLAPDEVLDLGGLGLAPGFIDMHSHSDFTLPGDPEAQGKLLQGVTTEVIGNCGLGLFPANAKVETFYEKLSPMIFGEKGGGCFTTLERYRARLHENGISPNAAPLVSHGNVRCLSMGLDDRAPTSGELDGMRDSVRQAMDDGAFGMSTGLVYAPGAYAQTDEIIELAKVVGTAGGFYATHMRDEGAKLIPSVEEALTIGREAKIPVQISHHKAMGRFNWGKVKTTLAMVDRARESGMDVTSDVYPYTAGATVLSAMFLPLWAFEGSQEALLQRLRDPDTRARMVKDSHDRFLRFAQLPGILDSIVPKRLVLPVILRELSKLVVVSSVRKQHHYEGMSLYEIRKARKQPLYEMLLDLLLEEELAISAIAHVMKEEDVEMVMKHPATMLGTDGFPQREGKPHPRGYATYPRVLDHYVGTRRLFSVETAIHKMSGLVAQKLGLSDRGVVRPGAFADLVVLDPKGVRDRATYASPKAKPEGIPHVFVNGAWTVKDGVHTGARGGRVLSRRARA